MALFYVKAGGTATGDGGRETTARTGTWNASTADYYDLIDGALSATTAPTAGDWIIVSDASSDITTGNIINSIPNGVSIVVVSDTNQDVYTPATAALVDNPANIGYSNQFAVNATRTSVYAGYNCVSGQTATPTADSASFDMRDCVLGISRNSSSFGFYNKQSAGLIVNSTLINAPTGNGLPVLGGQWQMYGGEWTVGTGASVVVSSSNLAGVRSFVGTDFSNNAASTTLFDFQSSAVDRADVVSFVGCPLYSNWSVTNLGASAKQSLIVQSCDSEYQYVEEQPWGVIEFVTSVYYTSHDTLSDGTTRGSYEFDSDATLTSPSNILRLGGAFRVQKLAAVNTEAAIKRKVRVRFATATGDTLDTGDLYFLVIFPSSNLAYQHSVVEHWLPDFQPGAVLSTETGNWTGPGLGTQYYMDIDMGSPNNGRVLVIPGVTKANVTVYFSWQLEFVA